MYIKTPLTEKALALASYAHANVKRLSGEPYIIHPVAVANLISEWGINDQNLIAAALTHDVLEDSDITYKNLSKALNKNIADLVDGVSKLKSHSGTLKKMIVKSYLDPRVAVLKLADRVHNMETLEFHNPSKRKEKSIETLNVYAALAESLGMWSVKTILEDLAFKNLDPKKYNSIKKEIEKDPRNQKLFMTHWKSSIEKILKQNGIKGKVEARKNGYWTLMKKRERAALKGKSGIRSFSDINDLISLRVVLEKLTDCYQMIGIIHSEFGEFVDYGRYDEFMGKNTRENGYSALQTTLELVEGSLEIAVTTKEMEDFNMWGVVSLIKRGQNNLEKYILKLVFTPNDEVRFLQKNATGIDFAYLINPRLGADAVGIKIDGTKFPIKTILPNASTVEVMVGEPRRAPNESFLMHCLPGTGKIIREQLNLSIRDDFVRKGKNKIEPILAERGILMLEDLGECVTKLLYWYGSQSVEDLYYKIGRGNLSPGKVDEWLNSQNIVRDIQNWSTIRLAGRDQPGILSSLTKLVSEMGGNILTVSQDIDQSSNGKLFKLRIVIEGISSNARIKLSNKISEDKRFIDWKIV